MPDFEGLGQGSSAKLKVLNCAAVSGVNLGDVLLAELIPWVAGREVVLCDLSGASTFIPGILDVRSVYRARRFQLSKVLPRFLKLVIKRNAARRRLKALAKEYDEVWIGGGNLLFDIACDNFALAMIVAEAFHKEGKLVKVISVGVGPFSSDPSCFLKRLKTIAQKITVRDHEGLRILREHEMCASILIDPAWYLGDFLSEKHGLPLTRERDTGRFGVNVMRPAALGSTGDYDTWVEGLAGNIEAIAKLTTKMPVLLISAFNGDPDVALAVQRRLGAAFMNVDIKELPRLSADWEEWSDFVRLDFVLSHRMHVAISALAVGIPSVIYPWQPKVQGVIEAVYGDAVRNFLIDSELFEPDEVLARLKVQCGLKASLEEKLQAAKSLSRTGYENF